MTTAEMMEKVAKWGIRVHPIQQDKLCVELPKDKAEAEEVKAFIMANKPAIMAEFQRRKDAEKAAQKETGYNEVMRVRHAWVRYNDEWERVMERGTSIFPAAPKEKIEDVEAQYPEGVALMGIYKLIDKSNYAASAAGKRALEAVINGAKPSDALEEAEKEWAREAARMVDNN